MKILVTGGCGFIGSNFIRYALENTDYKIVNLDALTYAGNLANLTDIDKHPFYTFVHGRIEDATLVNSIMKDIDYVIHFAAESHVDRSIVDAQPFIITNVVGTQVLLDAARKSSVKRFVHISTDEVYGSLDSNGLFTEKTPISPNSPYSASKAASDLLVRAAFHTYKFPAIITRCSNNYGPYQYPEKLIPLMITNALENKPLPIYGDGLNVRDWIYVTDHCQGILKVLEEGKCGEVYNLGGNAEKSNLDVVKEILRLVGKPETLITFVKDRPGHDKRYAMDITKIKSELGWTPKLSFEEGLRKTVEWYIKHKEWWSPLKKKQAQ